MTVMPSTGRLDLAATAALWRAANYVTVVQLYLHDNVLLRRPLRREDVKTRLVGHWGTAPGINFVYAHLNHFLRKYSGQTIIIVGPGHGAAAVLANLFLEGTLGYCYPEFRRSERGLATLARAFGTDILPTELSPRIPGVLHYGGELGGSLGFAYGTVFDHAGLTTICLIGDGEAETGGIAAAWQSWRYRNPASSGVVLPILHLNKYRLTSPSIFGTMSRDEISAFFRGNGYQARFVTTSHRAMASSLNWAFARLAANRRERGGRCLWPILVLCTPKGWTGPGLVNGLRTEDSFRSHKLPIQTVQSDADVAHLGDWLNSYNPQQLFTRNGSLQAVVKRAYPARFTRRIGRQALALVHTPSSRLRIPKSLPSLRRAPSHRSLAPIATAEAFLSDIMTVNSTRSSFRIFSPDELDSNGVAGVLRHSGRAFHQTRRDLDGQLHRNGAIMELLNEQVLQAWYQGHIGVGHHGLFASYECFFPIIASTVAQHLKYLSEAQSVRWRAPRPSANYLLTSLAWGNNYSHQNPDIYSIMVAKYSEHIRLLFPPDGNTLAMMLRECLQSADRVNILAAAKTPLPLCLRPSEADSLVREGVMVAPGSSVREPDVILAACGDYSCYEAVKAGEILASQLPNVVVRVLFIGDLTRLGPSEQFKRAFAPEHFDELFPLSIPVVMSFIGYAAAVRGLLACRPAPERFSVHGYADIGEGASVPERHRANRNSSVDLALDAAEALFKRGRIGLSALRVFRDFCHIQRPSTS
jgi:xylulose-5-phosphate/fructose-6-phosphate phosphoketolase